MSYTSVHTKYLICKGSQYHPGFPASRVTSMRQTECMSRVESSKHLQSSTRKASIENIMRGSTHGIEGILVFLVQSETGMCLLGASYKHPVRGQSNGEPLYPDTSYSDTGCCRPAPMDLCMYRVRRSSTPMRAKPYKPFSTSPANLPAGLQCLRGVGWSIPNLRVRFSRCHVVRVSYLVGLGR